MLQAALDLVNHAEGQFGFRSATTVRALGSCADLVAFFDAVLTLDRARERFPLITGDFRRGRVEPQSIETFADEVTRLRAALDHNAAVARYLDALDFVVEDTRAARDGPLGMRPAHWFGPVPCAIPVVTMIRKLPREAFFTTDQPWWQKPLR